MPHKYWVCSELVGLLVYQKNDLNFFEAGLHDKKVTGSEIAKFSCMLIA